MTMKTYDRGIMPEYQRIRQRAQDEARRELASMTSELHHYGHVFTAAQALAMRKAMRGLRRLIESLEGPW